MTAVFARVVIALALVATGWGFARAQATDPTFELVVNAPEGATTITCVRGCTLSWVERGLNPHAGPQRSFEFSCNGSSRCSSARVGGWVVP